MSFESLVPSNAPTVGRTTSLTLDLDEVVLVEPGINSVRRGSDISTGNAEGVGGQLTNVKYWSSGAYSLSPLQDDITNIYEAQAGQASILGPTDFTLLQLTGTSGSAVPAVLPRNNFAQMTLAGADYNSLVATTGDPFLEKVWQAGTNLDPSTISGNTALVAAGVSPSLPNVTVPMDRTGLSSATFPQDAGFFLRWGTSGTPHDYPQYIWTFGFGSHSVTFTGDGKAILYEYCQKADLTYYTAKRLVWRYCSPKQVMATSHSLAIWPHLGPHGEKFIAFGNNQLDVAEVINTGFKVNSKNVAAHEKIYRADSAARGSDIDAAGAGHVTTAAQIWWDSRRDIRVKVQVSKLAWATSGTLIDFAHSVGTAVANTSAVNLTMAKITPTGTTLTGVVNDARTNVAFVPGTDSQPYPKFTFTGDGTNTPILYGYRLKQAEVTATISPTSFQPDISSVSVSGFAGDPSEESAYIDAYDLLNTHTRLKKRGRLSAAIDITDPYAGTVRLFQGYVTRPRSRQIGPAIPPGFSVNSGNPVNGNVAPGWRSYQLSMMGMHMRLSEKVTPNFGVFGQDPADTAGRPYKVTDVIRALLLQCGFASAQVDIPDLSYRLWPGNSGSLDDQIIQPGADICECILRLCRNMLGCYLWFNPNNGSTGKWQLLFATQPNMDGTFTPVYNFVTTPPAGKVPTYGGSYPAQTTWIDGSPDYLTIPPDFNAIIVTADAPLSGTNTRLKSVAYCYNYLSWNVPHATVSASPDHPDYIGYCKPLEIIDPSLVGNTDADTWAAVAWTTRRAYDFYCHAQQIVRFKAPLVLIYDSGLSQYRPIRFQDPISIDGDPSYLVKSVTINYTKSHMMMAEYEAIAPMPGQYFMGVDGLHFKRDAHKRLSQRATGHGTQSNHWGLLSVSAAEEQKRLALPLNNIYQVPLQNADGSFIPIAAYNTATGASG